MDISQKLVDKAREGSSEALEEIVRQLKDMVFRLALRMLYQPDIAEDAVQEILIKVVTNLGTYRGEASFKNWAMKIATNHLLNVRERAETKTRSFEEMVAMIKEDWNEPWKELESEPMQELIVEEFRIACLQGLLLGLDRPHRLAYILGQVFDVSSREGGEIMGIQPDAFRKRLQRSRSKIRGFLSTKCALVRPGNPCVCERQTDYYLAKGDFKTDKLVFTAHPCRVRHNPSVLAQLEELDELSRVNLLLRSYPGIDAPPGFTGALKELIASSEYKILD